MTDLRANMMGIIGDESGQASVEFTLILGAFVLPMVWVLNLLLSALTAHYRMVVFFETLPFP